MIYPYKGFRIELDLDIVMIRELWLCESMNHHTELKVKGILQEMDRASSLALGSEKIIIKDQDGKVYFKGQLVSMQIKKESLFYQLELTASAFTCQMDQEKKRKVFQNLDMTYRDILEEVLSQYENASYIDTVTKGKKIPHMIIQYDETDWEFLIRLASHFHEGICVNSQSDFIQFIFGFSKEDTKKIHGDLDNQKWSLLGNQETVRIKSKERYEAGHTVDYKDYLYSVRSEEMIWDREEFIYQVEIEKNKESAFPYRKNINLAGIRIMANTKVVERNRIQLQFQMEDKGNRNTPFFPYGGEVNNEVGFYMPDVGSQMEVYFPNAEEESAVVVSARRATVESISNRNHDMKYMKNKEGLELYMDSSKVHLMNGMANTAVELKSDGTLSIYAPETIHLESSRNLDLGCSAGKLSLYAEKGICINAGTVLKSKILLEESGNIVCKANGNILYKRNEAPESEETQKNSADTGTKNAVGADKIRGAVMALSGVEFISQTVTGTSDFQDASAIVSHLLGKGGKSSGNHNQSEDNPIKEKLFQNDKRLFHSFSYGENKNG